MEKEKEYDDISENDDDCICNCLIESDDDCMCNCLVENDDDCMCDCLIENDDEMFTRISDECEHQYIIDLIDVDPDRSQTIEYCLKCFDVKNS